MSLHSAAFVLEEYIVPVYPIVVVGASAGGVEAMRKLAGDLPEGLPAAMFVVNHFPPHANSVFPQILDRAGRLPAAHARDGQPIQPGRIYVAPPDCHMLVKRGSVKVTRGPKENGHRPAIDPLFRTAARAYGSRVIGVVLSGTLDDGTAGMEAIKSRRGTAIVQDPADAAFPGMPRSVIENVPVDSVLPISKIGAELVSCVNLLLRRTVEEMPEEDVTDIVEAGTAALLHNQYPGPPSALTCPECGGALWEINEGELVRYRCHVGHGYSDESLLSAQHDKVEAALWAALRTLQESAEMTRRLADRANRRGHQLAAGHLLTQSQVTEERAMAVRNVLINPRAGSVPDSSNGDP